MEKGFVRKQLNNGVNLFAHTTKKYTTTVIKVFIHQNLERDIATKTSLLPLVLKRGCEKFPSEQKIRMYLEELYGTGFGVDVIKKGERHILMFEMDIVMVNIWVKQYFPRWNVILRDILLTLYRRRWLFKDYLNQEKDILKRNIKGLFNNKMQYAVERCFEKM